MRLSSFVKKRISDYEGASPAIKEKLVRLLSHGALGGTGKLLILAVDQGFEHGPRAFLENPQALDPHAHFEFAAQAGLSAYAAPLGFLEAGVDSYLGAVPLILKMNSGNSLTRGSVVPTASSSETFPPNQALTARVEDAVRLGCIGIGFTLYPGSPVHLDMLEELKEVIAQARSYGLIVVVWSYPRGPQLSKSDETALDVVAYGAHMACLMGAHIVKVKIPSATFALPEARSVYEKQAANLSLPDRIHHVVQSCFQGKRLVIFSGGEAKDQQSLFAEAAAVRTGQGAGCIIGRNFFQYPTSEALDRANGLIGILTSSTGEPHAH